MTSVCAYGRPIEDGADRCDGCEFAGKGPAPCRFPKIDLPPHPADDPAEVARHAITNGHVAPDEQLQPEPPDPLPAIPAFPVDKLTGPLAAFVNWCIRDGLHAEGAAGAGLAVLAALTGPASLRMNQKRIRGILWIALVGIASSGKTPAIEHALYFISQDFASRYDQYVVELGDWHERHAADPQTAGPRPAEPEPLVWDDPTVQAVARWLNSRAREPNGDPSGALIDDELASILAALDPDRGGSAADRAKWLKLWSGVPLIVKRVGSGGARNEVSIVVTDPVCSLAGALVPDNLPLLGKQGSGFRPRWLPFYLPPVRPQWLHAGDYPARWENCVKALLQYRCSRDWYLKDAGRNIWEDARARWGAQQDDAEPDDVIEALRKADVQCLRIALVIAESLNPGSGGDIPEKAVACAVAIVDYAIDVWRALPGGSIMNMNRAEDVMDLVYQRMLAWLETRPKGNEGLPPDSAPRPRATRSELQRWIHEKPEKITALVLEHDARFPGCKVIVPQAGGGIPTTYLYFPERASYTPLRAEGAVLRQHRSSETHADIREEESAGRTGGQLSTDGVADGVASSDATPFRNTVRDTDGRPAKICQTPGCTRPARQSASGAWLCEVHWPGAQRQQPHNPTRAERQRQKGKA